MLRRSYIKPLAVVLSRRQMTALATLSAGHRLAVSSGAYVTPEDTANAKPPRLADHSVRLAVRVVHRARYPEEFSCSCLLARNAPFYRYVRCR
jgi:hypothetical protein